jgi:hypothetical protein
MVAWQNSRSCKAAQKEKENTIYTHGRRTINLATVSRLYTKNKNKKWPHMHM